MYKDFEDWWEYSGIKETDSYSCIAQTYQFNNENIPQAFESFARNCYTSGAVEGVEHGKKYSRGEMIETMLAYLDMLKIPNDIKTVRECIDVLKKSYTSKIEDDEFGFPMQTKC